MRLKSRTVCVSKQSVWVCVYFHGIDSGTGGVEHKQRSNLEMRERDNKTGSNIVYSRWKWTEQR